MMLMASEGGGADSGRKRAQEAERRRMRTREEPREREEDVRGPRTGCTPLGMGGNQEGMTAARSWLSVTVGRGARAVAELTRPPPW